MSPDERPPVATGVIAALAALALALHLLVLAVTPFEVHRDEFLYFAMGRHLRLFRMDFPPLIAILANASRAIFGDSLAAVRVLPALAGALLLVLAALVARELGGRRFAQGVAALGVFAPVFLRAGTLFQPVILDQIWWTLGLLFMARLARGAGARGWIGFGVAMGLGLLTKFSIAFFGLAALVAMLATPSYRADFRTRWPWIAAAIALVIGSPSIVGQLALHFPVVGQMHDLQGSQLTHVTYWSFVAEQPVLVAYAAFVVAVVGAYALLFWPPLARFRALGLTCVLVFLLLMLMHGKSYYAAPIYPALVAAGAVRLEALRGARVGPLLRWGAVAAMALLFLAALPLAVPLLSREATAAYAARFGPRALVRTNRGEMDRLPQDYADMMGWQNQVRETARIYHALPPAEQRETVIYGENYGRAGATEFYAKRYGLPQVVSSAGSFWFFGPGTRPGRVLIAVGNDSADVAKFYGDVRLAARLRDPWRVEEERDVPIWVARQPRITLQQLWPSLAGNN